MNNKVRDFYNRNAAVYDNEQDRFGFIRAPEWEIAISAIKKIAGKNHSLLEIGAGTGRFTLEAAPLVRQATVVDISENMLDIMSKKANKMGINNIKQINGNFMEINFNEQFDIITGFSAIEYINDANALFAKISGLLAPGGHLILTTPHDTFLRSWGIWGNYFRQGIFMNAFSKKEMETLLTGNGFVVKDIKDLCFKNLFVKGILLFVYATK